MPFIWHLSVLIQVLPILKDDFTHILLIFVSVKNYNQCSVCFKDFCLAKQNYSLDIIYTFDALTLSD